jgi:hypothetical protein
LSNNSKSTINSPREWNSHAFIITVLLHNIILENIKFNDIKKKKKNETNQIVALAYFTLKSKDFVKYICEILLI